MGLVALLVTLLLPGCGSASWTRRNAGSVGPSSSRQDPALSGNGQLLASLVSRGGRDTVILQEQGSGRLLPLPQLQRLEPHRSPSLSWNGRYLALVGQQGDRRPVLILDRARGQLHRIPLPGDAEVERVSLAPDGQRLAVGLLSNGRPALQLIDLSGLLEADRPGGLTSLGGGVP